MQLQCFYKCELHSTAESIIGELHFTATTESVIGELHFTAGFVEGTDWVCPLAST